VSVPTGLRELQVLFFAIDQVACGLISGAGTTLFVTRQERIGFWIFLRCEECRRTWRFWEIGRLARMSAPKMVNGALQQLLLGDGFLWIVGMECKKCGVARMIGVLSFSFLVSLHFGWSHGVSFSS
jgi:hypothetical protein